MCFFSVNISLRTIHPVIWNIHWEFVCLINANGEWFGFWLWQRRDIITHLIASKWSRKAALKCIWPQDALVRMKLCHTNTRCLTLWTLDFWISIEFPIFPMEIPSIHVLLAFFSDTMFVQKMNEVYCARKQCEGMKINCE